MVEKQKLSFLELYNFASMQRAKWFNAKWRIAVILFGIAVSFFVWQHLTTEYPQYNGDFVRGLQPDMALGERVFSWFAGGLMLGALLFAVLLEGEFVLGTRKISEELEKDFVKFFPSGKMAKKPAKKR